MPAPNKRKLAYRHTFTGPQGSEVLQDLLRHAEDAKDPVVRCGRMDMIARIVREAGKRIEEITE